MVVQVPDGIPYRGTWTIAVLVILCVITITVVGLRLYSRHKILKQAKLGWTDLCIIVSTVSLLVFVGFHVYSMLNYGIGVHVKDFHTLFVNEFREKYIAVWRTAITQRILFELTTCLIKLSILLFLDTLSAYRSFHFLIYILMFLDVVLAICSSLMVLLQCTPLRAAFFPPGHRPPGSRCYYEWFVVSQVLPICNAVLDALCWLIPMYLAWHVSDRWKERLRVAVVLCIGLTAVIASVARIVILKLTIESRDVTWYFWEVGLWAAIELSMAIVCACCPALMPIIRLIYRKIRGTESPQRSRRPSDAVRRDLENIGVELDSRPSSKKIEHTSTDASSNLNDHHHENMLDVGTLHRDGDGLHAVRISGRAYYASTEAFANAGSTGESLSGTSTVSPSLETDLNHQCSDADVELGSGSSGGNSGRRADPELDLESGTA